MSAPSYRRLILGLQSDRIDKPAFRAAVSLARSLKLELHAILVENQSLLRAARLPMARELVLPTYDWRPVDPERLIQELKNEAEHVRLRVVQETRDFGIECSFEVRRGDPAVAVTEQCNVQDIITIIDTVDTIERLAGATRRMKQAALASEASVLLLPPHATLTEGPVIAVILDLRDETLAIASQIAEVSGRALLILLADSERNGAPGAFSAEHAEMPDYTITLPLVERSASGVLHALGSRRGYCLVVNRSLIDLTASSWDQLPTKLGMPVLITESVMAKSREGNAP